MNIQPYTVNIPQSVLNDLQARLTSVRWTDEIPGMGWGYGAELSYMKEFAVLEEPELRVEELRAFYRPLRQSQ